jgi:hypothetical protein
MDLRKWLGSWPVIRQLQQGDSLGLGKAAQSPRSAALEPRTATADRMARSVCPYCAVGCGQRVFVKDEQVIQIEGDPDSPVSRGRLCPKGAASKPRPHRDRGRPDPGRVGVQALGGLQGRVPVGPRPQVHRGAAAGQDGRAACEQLKQEGSFAPIRNILEGSRDPPIERRFAASALIIT